MLACVYAITSLISTIEQGGVVPTAQEVAAKAKADAKRKEDAAAHQRAEAEAREAEGDVRVTPAQLAALDADEEVRTLLRDGDLATLVREVDASPDPHRALLAARSNPRMLELMSRVLAAVGEDPLPEEL